jgi:hypothetical protein
MIGIRHGLPGIYHPDEPIVVSRAVNAVINGEFNPKFFHWPSLLMYLLYIEYYLIFKISVISGVVSSTDELERFYVLNRDVFHLWGRYLIAFMSVGTAYFFYLTVALWKDKRTAVLCLILGILSPLLVKHGQFITPDVPGLFFTSISIYFLGRFYFKQPASSQFMPNLLLFGVFIGLAGACKYNYLLLGLTVISVLILKSGISISKRIILILSTLIISVLVFFICNPFILIDFKFFLSQLREISLHLREGHIGMETQHPSIALLANLIKGSGIGVFTSAITGIILSFRKDFKWTVSLLFFPVFILLSHGRWPVTADRYSIPLLIAVIPFSAIFISRLFEFPLRFRSIAVILTFLVFLEPVFYISGNCAQNLKEDTREIAHRWINQNIPAGSRIALEKDGPFLKAQSIMDLYHRNPAYYFFTITPWYGKSFRTEDSPIEQIIRYKPQYVITNSGVYSRYAPGAPSERDFPDIYKVWRNYYDTLEKIGTLLYEIDPADKYSGLTVRVYRIPDYIYENMEIKKVTIEEMQ